MWSWLQEGESHYENKVASHDHRTGERVWCSAGGREELDSPFEFVGQKTSQDAHEEIFVCDQGNADSLGFFGNVVLPGVKCCRIHHRNSLTTGLRGAKHPAKRLGSSQPSHRSAGCKPMKYFTQ
jgi:hypothetical protein